MGPGYSIFHDTLADMTWPAVEEAARQNTPLLVPVAVIEQHGPHLPLATDTYGAHLLCRLVAMAGALTETLLNCASWGFRRLLIINHHDDSGHNLADIAAAIARFLNERAGTQ